MLRNSFKHFNIESSFSFVFVVVVVIAMRAICAQKKSNDVYRLRIVGILGEQMNFKASAKTRIRDLLKKVNARYPEKRDNELFKLWLHGGKFQLDSEKTLKHYGLPETLYLEKKIKSKIIVMNIHHRSLLMTDQKFSQNESSTTTTTAVHDFLEHEPRNGTGNADACTALVIRVKVALS